MKRTLEDNGDGDSNNDDPIALCHWYQESGTQECQIFYVDFDAYNDGGTAIANSIWLYSRCAFENFKYDSLAYYNEDSTMSCKVTWRETSYTASCSVAKLAQGAMPYEACTCLTASERYLDTECWESLDCDWKQETYQEEIEECSACEKTREDCSCSFLETDDIDYNGIPWSDSMLSSIDAVGDSSEQYNLQDIYPSQPSVIYQDFPHDMQIGCRSSSVHDKRTVMVFVSVALVAAVASFLVVLYRRTKKLSNSASSASLMPPSGTLS